ncbi:MAG: hypothetical protein LRY73_09445 [Bacillus sp. (in: Bacteria)]|nr:hypothetical protein [Bacillus sp. (in: firmicutes)]
MQKKYLTFILILVIVATVLFVFQDPDTDTISDSPLENQETEDLKELERLLVNRETTIRELENNMENLREYNNELRNYLQNTLQYLFLLDQEGIEVPDEFLHYYESVFGGLFTYIIAQEDYHLELVDDAFTLEFFVRPEWIPLEDGQEFNLNEHVLSSHDTEFSLEAAINRGDFASDIYFLFNGTHHLNLDEGNFITHVMIGQDGSITTGGCGFDCIKIYDKNMDEIELGQRGFGPGADFSFGIEREHMELLEDGFYVKITEFKLYEYRRK